MRGLVSQASAYPGLLRRRLRFRNRFGALRPYLLFRPHRFLFLLKLKAAGENELNTMLFDQDTVLESDRGEIGNRFPRQKIESFIL